MLPTKNREGPSFIGLVSGLASIAYTGVLLSSLASVLFWQTAFLPILFTTSALSCGIACVFLSMAFVEGRQSVTRPLMNLIRIDSVAIVMEAVILAFYLAWGLSDNGTASVAWALVTGDLSLWFWGIVFAVGLVAPFVMERFVSRMNYRTQLVWIAAAVLLGGFALRFCIVAAGAYDVTQMSGAMGELAAALLISA
ncbi:NrfD/PsrC family molybdoenzyme membrane anchor subunit [Adlercreutzia sp. ZJ138]|uniref:NrfD/PsrC family molybdoenzyme membrane anchor subunit n=1 Tax=Adlercreutzia sp. ZJ138 TaxID=2709405 RepID=UPI0013EA1DE2|nr:NrfD/PsrC family molybdoenzyme membrane anchor subunit [Adlercreutzia sp. ZJ138]